MGRFGSSACSVPSTPRWSAWLSVVLPVVVLGVLAVLQRPKAGWNEPNQCEMSHMLASYEQVGVVPAFPKYKLVRYLDNLRHPHKQQHQQTSREEAVRAPQGSPVLFVPGHLGDYKQVRSFGGAAAAAVRGESPHHNLDFYALDFGEEMTALSGALAWRQAAFLNEAVRTIRSLYKRKENAKVIVVGHSFGGVVARAAFTLESYSPNSISDLVTLGSPHAAPPFLLDPSISQLYRTTNDLWQREAGLLPVKGMAGSGTAAAVALSGNATVAVAAGGEGGEDEACVQDEGEAGQGEAGGGSPSVQQRFWEQRQQMGELSGVTRNVALVSIFGGQRDTFVYSSQCDTSGITMPANSISISTGEMAGVGFTVDHMAMLWCGQVVSRVTEGLIGLVQQHDTETSARERVEVLANALLSPSALDHWTHGKGRRSVVEKEGTVTPWYLLLGELGLVRNAQLWLPAWVLVCLLVVGAALSVGVMHPKGGSKRERSLVELPSVASLLLPPTHVQGPGLRRAWARLSPSARKLLTGVLWWGLFGSMLSPAVEAWSGEAAWWLQPPCRAMGTIMGLPANILDVLFLEQLAELTKGTSLPDGIFVVVVLYLAVVSVMLLLNLLLCVLGIFAHLWAGPSARKRWLNSLWLKKLMVLAGPLAFAFGHFGLADNGKLQLRLSLSPRSELTLLLLALWALFCFIVVSLVVFPTAAGPGPRSGADVWRYQRLVVIMHVLPTVAALFPVLLPAWDAYYEKEDFFRPSNAPLLRGILILGCVTLNLLRARLGHAFPMPESARDYVVGEWGRMFGQHDGRPGERGGGGGGAAAAEAARRAAAAASAAAAAVASAVKGGVKGPHGECGACFHADGGIGAIFEESNTGSTEVARGVVVGPAFRVVACDCCSRWRQDPRLFCEFCVCSCRVCTGGAGAVAAGWQGGRGLNSERRRGHGSDLPSDQGHGLALLALCYLTVVCGGLSVLAEPVLCHWVLLCSALGLTSLHLRYDK